MRISWLITPLVVASMGRYPPDDRPLKGHRAQDGEYDTDRGCCFKSPMGKVTMIPHINPEHRGKIHDGCQPKFNRAAITMAEENKSTDETQGRSQRRHQSQW